MSAPHSQQADERHALHESIQPNDAESCATKIIMLPRRKRRRKNTAPARRYQVVLRLARHDLVRCVKTGIYYVSWYESDVRQTRRVSLKTDDDAKANEIVRRIESAGITGNPKAILKGSLTLREALLIYEESKADNASAKAGSSTSRIHKHLIPLVGHILLHEWNTNDYKKLKNKLEKRGLALGTISRILSDLRAAFYHAEKEKFIDRAPEIPDPMTDDDRDRAPYKGRAMTPAEIARLIDAIDEIQLLDFMVALINTAGRPITILECETTQIEKVPAGLLFDMNPKGRQQNKKYRPKVIIPATWEPWIRAVPPGRLITCNGKPVTSLKTAFRAARERSGLEPDHTGVPVNFYSIRHTLGEYFNEHGVPFIQREIQLGHRRTYRKKTTTRYSNPENTKNPNYLRHATRAIEQFVREINSRTRKWDLLQPRTLKPGYLKRHP